MKSQTFEEYLMELHDENFSDGVASDEVEDSYEDWLSELQTDDLISYANDYAKQEKDILQKDLLDLRK